MDPIRGVAKKTSKALRYPEPRERLLTGSPLDNAVLEGDVAAFLRNADAGTGAEEQPVAHRATATPTSTAPSPVFRDDARGIWLYQGNSLALLDAIAAKHPDGCFDMMLPLDDKRRLV